LPSSNLDEGRLDLARRRWVGGVVDRSADHPACLSAGIGLESIAPGTLPLAVFGPERYPVVMGRIAMPSLIAQAAAPSISTALIETGGVNGAVRVFVSSAAVNLMLAAGLYYS
jgi:hypothetical protein